MAKRSRPADRHQRSPDLDVSPEHVRVVLAEVGFAAREGVRCRVGCGLQVVAGMMAADVERICGPVRKQDADRTAYRHGSKSSCRSEARPSERIVRGPGGPTATRSRLLTSPVFSFRPRGWRASR